MHVWLLILIPSAIVGGLCSYLLNGKKSYIVAGALPWFGLLAVLMYQEYFVPYQGGGASMWPIAQLFGGTAAAVIGIGSCALFKTVQTRLT